MDRKVNDGSPSSLVDTMYLETSAPRRNVSIASNMSMWRTVTTSNNRVTINIFNLIVWWSSEGLLTNLNGRVILTIDLVWLLFYNTTYDLVRAVCAF